jgi:hypothetical protein
MSSFVQFDFEMAPGRKMKRNANIEGDTARLRYHLTSLYALRPIPEDMLRLVEQIDARREDAPGEGS